MGISGLGCISETRSFIVFVFVRPPPYSAPN
jgi:hypothetical protein